MAHSVLHRSASEQPTTDAADRWITLVLLTMIYALNVADRFIASTLMEPIKKEFSLSDSMVGFLTGTVLALFFVVSTYPAGVLTDRMNRKRLVIMFATVFSTMTAVCGIATSTMQFALARIGIGVAEAGTTPPSLSLLADKFESSRRPMVMTIFTIGAAIGGALGSGVGGWINDEYGWRWALVTFGLAGLPLMILTMTLVREPPRGALDDAPATDRVTISAALRFMWSQKSLVHLIAGATVVTFWGWGLIWWAPAFYHRSFSMTVGDVGTMLGSVHLFGGTAAVVATVFVMRWLGPRDPRLQLGFLALMVFGATFPSMLAFSAGTAAQSIFMFWLFAPVAYLFFGPNFGMINNLVPSSMRGQAIAIYLLTTNFANLAIAPQVVGWASDFYIERGYHPAESLRTALSALALTGFWGALHYVLAMRHVRRDLARVTKLG